MLINMTIFWWLYRGNNHYSFAYPYLSDVIKINLTKKKGSSMNSDDIGNANILDHLNILNICSDDYYCGSYG